MAWSRGTRGRSRREIAERGRSGRSGSSSARAVLALVAARVVVAAVRAGADDIAVGQEAAVGRRIDLPDRALLDEARRRRAARKMSWVSRRFCGEERARRSGRTTGRTGDRCRPAARAAARSSSATGTPAACGGQLGRRAVLVGGAEEQDVVAGLPAEAGVDVGRQHGAGQVAEVLDAVDVGQRAGDQELGSWDSPSCRVWT